MIISYFFSSDYPCYFFRSMKQNLVVFLADMYNVLEIHPAKCVRYPGEERAMQYLDGT